MKQKVNDSNSPDNQERGIRLQVVLARSGVASRRSAESIIGEGRVRVNGAVVTEMGTRVSEEDEILLDGKPVLRETRKLYILLNKPAGYVSSMADDQNRPIAADLLKEAFPERVYNVGRLDMYSSGALIFTNDGDFAAALSHPSSGIEKEYVVETSLPFRDEVLHAFTRGIRVESVFYRAVSAERLNARKMKVVLVEGKNREIRRVLAAFNVHVKNLTRTRIGPIELGDLPTGAFRHLTRPEIDALSGADKDTPT